MQNPTPTLSNRTKEIITTHPKLSKVPSKLSNPHKLVQQAKENLDSKKNEHYVDEKYLLRTSYKILSIDVTKGNISRALRFFDTFIKLIEKLGYHMDVKYDQTILTIKGEQFELKILEKSNRKVDDTIPSWRNRGLVPNGKLSFKLCHAYATKEWVDGRLRLEQQLPKIVAFFEIETQKKKIERIENDKRQAEHQRLLAIKKQEQAKVNWENKQKELLLEHATQSRKAEDLLLFINRIENKLNNNEAPSQNLSKWLTWAKGYQKAIDPVSGSIESFIDSYNFKETVS